MHLATALSFSNEQINKKHLLNMISHNVKNHYLLTTLVQYVLSITQSSSECFSLTLCQKKNVKITGVPWQRISTGWFYNKLIKSRDLPWPHALLLVDERHKEWRWSQGVSLYGGNVRTLSLKKIFEPHQVVARWWIAITGLNGKRLVRFILILHHLFIHHED